MSNVCVEDVFVCKLQLILFIAHPGIVAAREKTPLAARARSRGEMNLEERESDLATVTSSVTVKFSCSAMAAAAG